MNRLLCLGALAGLLLLSLSCAWILPESVQCDGDTAARCARFSGFVCDVGAGHCVESDSDEESIGVSAQAPSSDSSGDSSGSGDSGGDTLYDPSGDNDKDGLSNAFESTIGTDENEADSDGDGYSDTYEYLTYFSPLDSEDQPYAAHYPRGPLPSADSWNKIFDGQEASWNVPGHVTNGWELPDQQGREIELHSFYGCVVVLEFVVGWCSACNASAPSLDDRYELLKHQGLVVIQLMGEGVEGAEPSVPEWVETHELGFPVFSVYGHEILTEVGITAYPTFILLNRELQIQSIATESQNVTEDEDFWDQVDTLLNEGPPSVPYPMPDNADELYDALNLVRGSWTQQVPAKPIGLTPGASERVGP